ncbi:AAA family ATPase [Phormidium sp. FACHB-1136]|uniref:GumC family protein n=1 Tax=Phormidium sp. FACHB-1136 TaxID=2692848 RepID=UPI0016879858|nr:AAA family ATPase [Phormidium sp. FACHB-1136]MBD2426683.1 AAA family ATPase [Phormidium sp. FACHB-1136]
MEDLKHIEPAANGNRDYPQLVVSPNLDAYRTEPDDEIELRDLFAALKRRWLPLLGVTTATFVGLLAFYVSRPPVYERSFSMAIEPLDKLTGRESASSGLAALAGGAGLAGVALPRGAGGADYSSLIAVLQSELVLEPVVEAARAQTEDPEFGHGALLEDLTVEQVELSKILEVSFRSKDPDLVDRVISELQTVYVNYSTETQQMSLIRRLNDLNAQVAVQRQEVASTQASLLQFQGQNQILDLKSASEALETRRSEVLLEQQNTRITIETTLEKYNNLRNQVGLQPAEAILVANLSESPVYQSLLTQYRELESEIAVESARFRADTPMIQALQDKQRQLLPLLEAEVERNLGSAVTSAGRVTPQTLGYQGSIGRDLAKELVSAINQIQVLEVQYQSLSQLYGTLSDQLDNLVNLGSNFREIERNLALSEAALQGLLAAQQELKLQLEAETNPWIIVSGYDLSKPLEPESRLVRGLVIALVGSTVLGLGTVFLLEMLDRSYHGPDHVGEDTGLPILASVPKARRLLPLIHQTQANLAHTMAGSLALPMAQSDVRRQANPRSSHFSLDQLRFEAAFQDLSANLRLLSANRSIQVVAISSVAAGEGKTTAACHLALASAKAGRRVLLVDCDLVHPQLGSLFGLETPHKAFTANEGLGPTVKPLLDNGNLDLLQFADQDMVLSTGLWSNSDFDRCLKKCRTDYDLIILDTSGSLNEAATKLVSYHADGLLLVIRIGQTNRDLVNDAVRDFRTTSQTSILGLVANGVDLGAGR